VEEEREEGVTGGGGRLGLKVALWLLKDLLLFPPAKDDDKNDEEDDGKNKSEPS